MQWPPAKPKASRVDRTLFWPGSFERSQFRSVVCQRGFQRSDLGLKHLQLGGLLLQEFCLLPEQGLQSLAVCIICPLLGTDCRTGDDG